MENKNSAIKFRKIGWAAAILNIFAMLNAMYFFLFMAKFPIVPWLFFNACFPSALLFLIGFFSNKKSIMAASIPFLAYFGIGGLFLFSWTGGMIMAQIGHIAMTLAILYTITITIKSKEYKQAIIGFILGSLAFLIVLPIQNNYVKSHPEYIKKLGDPKFENFINE